MKNIVINITDHNDQCQTHYGVEYKQSGDVGWTVLSDWYAPPPIKIIGVEEGVSYDVRITRYCCDGQISIPATETTLTSLDTPVNFTATPFVGPEIQLQWDNDPNVDTYIIDRALDAGFTMSPTEIYNGPYTPSIVHTSGLIGATTYYFRIRATKPGFPDSGYATANATTP